MRRTLWCLLFAAVGLSNSASGDTIHFKDGSTVTGKIVDETVDPFYHGGPTRCGGQGMIAVSQETPPYGTTTSCYPNSVTSVEKQIRPPQGVALQAREDSWGPEKYGFRTQLIPAKKSFKLGEPIPFHLLLKNVSPGLKTYDSQGTYHQCVLVLDSDNTSPPSKKSPAQTMGGSTLLDAGETAVIFESRDLAKEYVFLKPGVYTARFSEGTYGMTGDSTFPESNTVTFELLPGEISVQDAAIVALLKIRPNSYWGIWAFSRPLAQFAPNESPGTGVLLAQNGRLMDNLVVAQLWISPSALNCLSPAPPSSPAPCDGKEGRSDKRTTYCDFLGGNNSGHFYYLVTSPCLLSQWPTVRKDIVAGLGLQ